MRLPFSIDSGYTICFMFELSKTTKLSILKQCCFLLFLIRFERKSRQRMTGQSKANREAARRGRARNGWVGQRKAGRLRSGRMRQRKEGRE